MWQVDNRTPFAAAQGWIRDRNGAEVWLVVVKASFDIRPDGSLQVSKDQPPPLRVPEHHGKPGESSIRYDSDFVLTKTTTDVLVIGRAHAPGGKPVRELDAGFRVGALRKLVRVFGNRTWGLLGAGEPASFTTMPIVYERAFGGIDLHAQEPYKSWEWRNPVGCGFATRSAHLQDAPMPNIESADCVIRAWDDRPAPAGLGPIASHWQPRAAWAGTYDAHWEATRQPLLAIDCDDRYFQCAPPDQQTSQFLRGAESVTLLNLSANGRLEFALPQIELSLQTHFMDGERRVHAAPRLHTVILEPDLPRLSLVWHSALECHAKVYKLDTTRVQWRSNTANGQADESVDNLLDLL